MTDRTDARIRAAYGETAMTYDLEWYRQRMIEIRDIYIQELYRDGFDEVTLEGPAGYLRLMREEQWTGDQVREAIRSSGEWRQKHTIPTDPPSPPTPEPALPIVRWSEPMGFYVVHPQDPASTYPVLPLGCHLGDGLSQLAHGGYDRLSRNLDLIAEAGYSHVRTWTTLGGQGNYWLGREVGPWYQPNFWDLAHTYRQMLLDRGLRWHLAAGDLFTTDDNIEEYFGDLPLFVDEHPGAIILTEAVNEAQNTTYHPLDSEWFDTLLKESREVNPYNLHALSAATGTEEPDILRLWTPSWMPFVLVHGYRGGHWYDKIRHIFSLTYEEAVRHVAWHGEPFGPGASAMYNGGELTPGVMALAATQAFLARSTWTFHSHAGVKMDEALLVDQPGFWETPFLISALPNDLLSNKWTRFHGGAAFGGTRVIEAAGAMRADHARHMDDKRLVVTCYGPEHRALPLTRPIEGTFYKTNGDLLDEGTFEGQTPVIVQRAIFVGEVI